MARLKCLQRRAYDLLSSRTPFLFLFIFIISFFATFHLIEFYILYKSDRDNIRCRSDCCDNIKALCLPCEPIDVVFTWVNGSDPSLLESMKKHVSTDDILGEEDLSPSRFDDKQELKYSLRSIEKYAPWIRHVFLVTAGQIPSWLDMRGSWDGSKGSRLTLISHEDIIPRDLLPTFSSPAIECFLHKIPGLSDRFLYFNDDIFLGAPIYLSDFYTPNDGYEIYTAWSVPDCAQGCPWSFLGDNSCDQPCNNAACDFDGGDCLSNSKSRKNNNVNHLDYLGDYPDSSFFDEDEKSDYIKSEDVIPNLELTFGQNAAHAKQMEDGVILQDVLEKKRGDNNEKFSSRKIKSIDLSNNSSLNYSTMGNSSIKVGQHKLNEQNKIYMSKNYDANFNSSVYKNSYNFSNNNHGFSVNMKNSTNTHNSSEIDSVVINSNTKERNKQNVLKHIFRVSSYNDSNMTDVVHRFNKKIMKTDKASRKKSKNITSSVKILNKDSTTTKLYNDLRKLDVYARSLIHTNKIFNKVYGFQNRKVPAHVPFLLEKKLLIKMHEKFSEHIEITKNNKFRRPNDFQFSFAYFHYLMSEKEEYTIEEIFDMYDTDKSGTWSDREVRTVLARVRGPPLTAATVHALESAAKECDNEEHRAYPTPPNERYMDSDMPTLTLKLIVNCPGLRGPLRGALGHKKPIAFSKPAATRTTFAMLSSNITKAVSALDEIRRDTKKFICINDNLDSSREPENEIVRMVLQELYEALLPIPSQWELPYHVANKFLRTVDLAAWQRSRAAASRTLAACALILIILTLHQLNCWKVIIKKIKKKI